MQVFHQQEIYIYDQFLEILYNYSNEADYDIVISNAIIVNNESSVKFGKFSKNIELNPENSIKNVRGRLFSDCLLGKLYKSDLIKKIKFKSNMKVAEDLEFLLEVFKCSNKNILVKEHMYNYVIRENSIIRSKENNMNEELEYCRSLIARHEGTPLKSSTIKHFINLNLNYAITRALNKKDYSYIKKEYR